MRTRIANITKGRWYPVVVLFIVVITATALNFAYTNQVNNRTIKEGRENDQKWCEMLVTLDDAYSSTPPGSALGRKLAEDIHRLRVDLEC